MNAELFDRLVYDIVEGIALSHFGGEEFAHYSVKIIEVGMNAFYETYGKHTYEYARMQAKLAMIDAVNKGLHIVQP